MGKEKDTLSRTDKVLLASYKTTMEALGAYLGDAFELVLHDIDDLDHSIIKIINGSHSGRGEGAPITDLALDLLEKINRNKAERFSTYFSKSKYGKPVKSITMAIFGEQDRVIGLLCINMYLDSPITSLLQSFTMNTHMEFVSENFITDSDELVSRALERVKKEVMEDAAVPPSLKNKEIITLLYYQGIFKMKNAIKTISADLHISKNTVYMHIRSLEND
jgi:predicted transcriptional regulator YheO